MMILLLNCLSDFSLLKQKINGLKQFFLQNPSGLRTF